jgi:hypothetical protein
MVSTPVLLAVACLVTFVLVQWISGRKVLRASSLPNGVTEPPGPKGTNCSRQAFPNGEGNYLNLTLFTYFLRRI